MNINSKLAVVGAVSAIAGATFIGASVASAHDNNGGQELVSKVAEQFNLSEDEVQAVFDDYREERHAEHEAEREEARATHLQELVDEGVITEEQRSELEAFAEEHHAKMEELRDQDLSRSEIRDAMEALRDEMEAWAEAEGLDIDDLRPEDGPGHGRGGHHQMRFGDDSDETETTDS